MSLSSLLSAETVSLNHLWTTTSPIFAANPPYSIRFFYNHTGTLGQFPGDLTAAGVTMEFSGQHGAPTIDSIGHIGANGTVFGGINAADIEGPNGLTSLDISEYPEDKYVNRGVLIDMPYCLGLEMLPEFYNITANDIQECATKENVEIKEGDSVLLRTGYGSLFNTDQAKYTTNFPGGAPDAATYLQNLKIFLTGADNLGWGDSLTNLVSHISLIKENGIYIVENMNLEDLSAACQRNGIWEFALVLNPPKIKGAAAMAVNAFAIFASNDEATSGVGSQYSLFAGMLVSISIAIL